jgi:U4/U6 small nuclear ribonucleoprotein PRP3
MPTADELARRVAEAKRKVAERQNKLSNPYAVGLSLLSSVSSQVTFTQAGAQSAKKKGTPAPEPAPQGAGLKMAAHPLLLDTTPSAPQSKKDRYKPMQPKFASIKANIRNAPTPLPAAAAPVPVAVIEARSNPYASGSITPASEGGFEGTPRERVGRSFKFNTKGKYVQIANQLRQEAQLEELKQRIAANARKAGLDTEFETLEKNIKV